MVVLDKKMENFLFHETSPVHTQTSQDTLLHPSAPANTAQGKTLRGRDSPSSDTARASLERDVTRSSVSRAPLRVMGKGA